jgi:hypothetical protein
MVAYCNLLGWFQMHVNNQWYLKNMWQTSSDGLTENMFKHSAKSKISPTKWCVNIHIQYIQHIHTQKYIYTCTIYTLKVIPQFCIAHFYCAHLVTYNFIHYTYRLKKIILWQFYVTSKHLWLHSCKELR